MKKICFITCSVLFAGNMVAQYKNDNVLYKTVYMQDLCKELDSHPNAVLLDVRTPGEYMDTSRGLNLGRFKNAVNIEVRDLGKRLAEINAYKNTPVFVYCSHSQRSRRASKMLADSGFTKVFNINGGMTGLRQLSADDNKCVFDKLETKNTYDIISAEGLCKKIARSPANIFILDVRPDSAFRHISTNAKVNAYGYFKHTVNIPLADLEGNIPKIPAGKEVIITDLFGDEAAEAAVILKKKNYGKVSVLLEGFDRYLNTDPKQLTCPVSAYITDIPFKIINAQYLKSFLEKTTDFIFLDARTADEFNNTHKNYWQNLGHLKNAINIPAADIEKEWKKIDSYKTKPIIVYVFSSSKEVYEIAAKLVNHGFKNVMVLQGGIFNVGWTAANIKGFASLAKLRVDIPAEN